jgi:hypothetical protein
MSLALFLSSGKMALSQATSYVRWLYGKQTNVLRTIYVFVPDDKDGVGP